MGQKVILLSNGELKGEMAKAISILEKTNCEIIVNNMDEVKSGYGAERILEVKSNELITPAKIPFVHPPTRAERRKEKRKMNN